MWYLRCRVLQGPQYVLLNRGDIFVWDTLLYSCILEVRCLKEQRVTQLQGGKHVRPKLFAKPRGMTRPISIVSIPRDSTLRGQDGEPARDIRGSPGMHQAVRCIKKHARSAYYLPTRARTILAARGWSCGLPRQGSCVGP